MFASIKFFIADKNNMHYRAITQDSTLPVYVMIDFQLLTYHTLAHYLWN